LVEPKSTDYKIPIYIKANENVSNATIEKLVIEFDINNFYPQKVDNGTMRLNIIDNTVIETVLENVKVPTLKANEEATLLTVRGDVIFENKDSSGILVKEVKFSEELNEKSELIDGYITIKHSPSIKVKHNPVKDILELECRVVESGNYKLELIDLLGKLITVKEFEADVRYKSIYNFEISVKNYANGSYIIIMNTPTERFSQKFIIQP